jgi:hypothetical protein
MYNDSDSDDDRTFRPPRGFMSCTCKPQRPHHGPPLELPSGILHGENALLLLNFGMVVVTLTVGYLARVTMEYRLYSLGAC